MTTNPDNSVNGAPVISRYGKTIFVRLPRSIQQPIESGCACDYCKAHPNETPMWDTLAVGEKAPKKGTHDFVCHVHMPDPFTTNQNIAAMRRKGKDI